MRFTAMIHKKFHVASPCRRWLYDLSPLLSPLSLLLLLVLSGCGTGDYEQRLAKRGSQTQSALNFNELYAPQPLTGTSVSVRVPVLFKESPLVEGVQGKDGKPIDPRRVKPTLFELPWLKFTYEGFMDNPEGGKLPFYCYVAAVNKAAGGVNDPAPGWKDALKNKGGTVNEWTDFQGQSPDGQKIPWKTIRFTGPQEFFTINKTGQEQYVSLPGVLDIYLHEEAGFYVLIAWRMPASIEQQVNPAKWVPMMAGCASVKQ
jgi:hypothetical protein